MPPLSLLLAEDNYPDVLLVREAIRLEKLDVELHVVSDGAEAIEFINRAEANADAPCPQFLLIDLNLPKKDGFEVLEQLRSGQKCKAIPVVIITSSDSPADQSRAAQLGANYFRKPPSYRDFMKLGGVLRAIVQERGL